MNNMKYGIQDYLGLPYSNYQVSFCFEFYFLSGKKEKKNLNRLSRLKKKNLSRIFICFVLSTWALFSFSSVVKEAGLDGTNAAISESLLNPKWST